MGVDPDSAAWAVDRSHSDEGPERDRMVAAEDERGRAGTTRALDQLRHLVAVAEDLRQVARAPVDVVGRLRSGRRDVAEVLGPDSKLFLKMFREFRISDCGRAHVDAAPTLTEVERGADDGDLLHGHGRKANVRAVVGSGEGAVRVLLADDDHTFLEALEPLIEHQPELTVVGAAANGL